eukprot:scaffold4588_cov112-Isochrysis_galbana.AAC.7
MGCHPDTGLGKKQTPFRREQQKQNLARRLPPRSPLLLNSRCGREQIADIVAGSSRTNRSAAMPPFLALCGGVVGGVVENGPDISTHISISAAHSVSSHTDRASRPDVTAVLVKLAARHDCVAVLASPRRETCIYHIFCR